MNGPRPSEAHDGPPVFEPAGERAYSLEVFAEISGVSSHTILMYRQHGLLPPAEGDPASYDDESLHALRRLERLRDEFSLNVHGLKYLAGLLDEIERLRSFARRIP